MNMHLDESEDPLNNHLLKIDIQLNDMIMKWDKKLANKAETESIYKEWHCIAAVLDKIFMTLYYFLFFCLMFYWYLENTMNGH